jgi:hypothetical protein
MGLVEQVRERQEQYKLGRVEGKADLKKKLLEKTEESIEVMFYHVFSENPHILYAYGKAIKIVLEKLLQE